jgi:hypothetical protein
VRRRCAVAYVTPPSKQPRASSPPGALAVLLCATARALRGAPRSHSRDSCSCAPSPARIAPTGPSHAPPGRTLLPRAPAPPAPMCARSFRMLQRLASPWACIEPRSWSCRMPAQPASSRFPPWSHAVSHAAGEHAATPNLFRAPCPLPVRPAPHGNAQAAPRAHPARRSHRYRTAPARCAIALVAAPGHSLISRPRSRTVARHAHHAFSTPTTHPATTPALALRSRTRSRRRPAQACRSDCAPTQPPSAASPWDPSGTCTLHHRRSDPLASTFRPTAVPAAI